MPRVGISYRPQQNLFYSGWNQTALLLAELCRLLEYEVILVDSSNSDATWWPEYPKELVTANLYQTTELDLLIDIDGLISPEMRASAAKRTVVFLRTFLQFAELDSALYIEIPYVSRSMKGVQEVWCWDLLNPAETIPSIQTMFSCPIRRVPFIWSSSVVDAYSNGKKVSYDATQQWHIHVAEKNKENTSSSILPLVAIREMCQKKAINADYFVHNMDVIKDNRFLKENVLDNIESETLPLKMVPKEPFYEWVDKQNMVLLSHSRFVPVRVGLLNAIWMGLPVVHNSPVLRTLHAELDHLYYMGNEISGICRAVSSLSQNPAAYYNALSEIRASIVERYAPASHREEWLNIMKEMFSMTKIPPALPSTSRPKVIERSAVSSPVIAPVKTPVKPLEDADVLVIAFSDMWPGFNYNCNFIIDALRHHLGSQREVRGVSYENGVTPHLILCGPYSENWKQIESVAPKVFFTAEHWAPPSSSAFSLYLTSSRQENSTYFRLPVWMTFIDWFSGATQLPADSSDNPIRLPLHFAMTPHPVGFETRSKFCGFVVTNPICTFRNETFHAVNQYKAVNSGGALYNNIGGPLALKYPGGGCGDLSKNAFFAEHRFTISFENAQIPGYITEKVLHAKMAGCVPIYWGDANTDTDFAPNSFINLSSATTPEMVVNVIKKLESNPAMCAAIAATPILNEEKKNKALALLTRMCERMLALVPSTTPLVRAVNAIDGIEKTYVINLDTRPDRWKKLMEAEPYLESIVERVQGVNGKTLTMNPFIYNLFDKNEFQWKKSIIGCNLSHISVWSKIATAETGNFFLVLEDDVRFQKNWMEQWRKCLEHAPADADLLYLGGVLPPNKPALPLASEKYNEYWSFIKPNTFFSPVAVPVFHFCAYSYILTRAGAKKLMSYMLESDKKSFTVSDHLLGHPSVGLKKYYTDPLLSYCFQEDDPVYVNSQFNDLHREDKFDSDIWNNTERFTEEELALFRTLVIPPAVSKPVETSVAEEKKQTVYFFPKEKETTVEPYEQQWLEDMMQVKLDFAPLLENTEIGHHYWFLVQRPNLHVAIHLFQQLTINCIPFKVIHISDEFAKDDISFYEYPMCKAVLRNYPREDAIQYPHVITIPLGYHLKPTSAPKTFPERDLVWSFHGTDWFERSTQLKDFIPFVPYSCHLQPNWNHPTKTKEKLYLSLMANSKFCPILRGQHSETFRMYEALESGTLPVTTITDETYLAWIEKNMGLSSLYDWTHPNAVLSSTITENTRMVVWSRWNAWKERIKNSLSILFK